MSQKHENRATDPAFASLLDNGFGKLRYSKTHPHIQPTIARTPDNIALLIPGKLTIATDGDALGREAGNVLATRATSLGWKVSLLPASNDRDWNDVLMAKRVSA